MGLPVSTSTKLQKQSQEIFICWFSVVSTATRTIAMAIMKIVAEKIPNRITFLRQGILAFQSTIVGMDKTAEERKLEISWI